MRLASLSLLVGSLCLSACGPEPRFLEGTVADIFGKPINAATVLAEGWQGRAASDAAGLYKLQVEAPGAVRLVAGADTYIKDLASTTVPEGEEAAIEKVDFRLWNKPEKVGFYAKGQGELLMLAESGITALGTDLSEMHGIRDVLNFEVNTAEKVEFLFSSTLRAEEIDQLDLKIFKLKYLEQVPFKGITGEQLIEPKFWMADVEVPFTLRGLYTDNAYVITPDAALAPGIYVFAHQDILIESTPGSLDKVPEEMRKAYPFEVK